MKAIIFFKNVSSSSPSSTTAMKRIRGFMLKHRVTKLFRHFFRRDRSSAWYQRLNSSPAWKAKPFSRLFRWGHQLCCKNPGPGYRFIGEEDVKEKPVSVPKGHLAVYVGQKNGDFQRVLVPVIYFNHPLFGELLRDAEKEYGFNHPGGITIPCLISEFESIQTRIKAGRGSKKMLTWKPSI